MKSKLFATMLVVMLAGMLLPIIPNVEAATSEPFIATIETTEGYALAGDSITYYLSILNNLTVNQTFSISTSTPPENFTVSIEPEYVMVLPGDTYRHVEITVSVDDDANIGEDWDMEIRVDSGRGISETLPITTTISAIVAGTVSWYSFEEIPVAIADYGAFAVNVQNTGTIAWTAGQYIVRSYAHQYMDESATWIGNTYNYTGFDEYFIHYFAHMAEEVTATDRYYTLPAMAPGATCSFWVHAVPTANTTSDVWKSRMLLSLCSVNDLYVASTTYGDKLSTSSSFGANVAVSGHYYNIDLDWLPENPSEDVLVIGEFVTHKANLTNIGNDTTYIEVRMDIDEFLTTLADEVYKNYIQIQMVIKDSTGALIVNTVKAYTSDAKSLSLTTSLEIDVYVNIELWFSITSVVSPSVYPLLDGKQIVANLTTTCLNSAVRSFTLDTADVGNISAPFSLTDTLKQSYFGIPLYLWVTLILMSVVMVSYVGMRRKCDEPGYAKGHPKVCKKEVKK